MAKGKIRQNPIKKAYRSRDFETYILWKTLPSFIKGKGEREIRSFGFSDFDTIGLIRIRNQREFADKFHLCPDTLTDWNKKAEKSGLVAKRIMMWARELTPNVMGGFYSKTVKEADAARVKLWLQFVEGWNEKTVHKWAGEDKETATPDPAYYRKKLIRRVTEALKAKLAAKNPGAAETSGANPAP